MNSINVKKVTNLKNINLWFIINKRVARKWELGHTFDGWLKTIVQLSYQYYSI